MPQLPLLLTIILAIASVILTLFSVMRVIHYIQVDRFEQIQYKPLLGLVHLRFALFIYLLGTLLIAGFSISLVL